jgi:beta-phosphoglucomutase family hydrolase
VRDTSPRDDLSFDAVLFDMDGVVTRTATLHAAAWKDLFDEFLRAHVAAGRAPFRPFDPETDYLAYVDGRPREAGVRNFLAARGVQLADGCPTGEAGIATVYGLSARKDALFVERMRSAGVDVFGSTIALIRTLREHGLKTAIVTSSKNGREVLGAAGVEDLFDVRVDGIDAATLELQGKPHPGTFLRAAALLGVTAGRAVIVEDAVPGVEAGRRGGFALVVGVDRGGNRDALMAHGADIVVADLVELDLSTLDARIKEKREKVLAWRVEQEGFDPGREHDMESLFTVGNGYVGIRGALDTPLTGSHADMLIAGVYDAKQPARPYSEAEFLTGTRGDHEHVELVSVPFPFRVRVIVDGVALDLAGARWRTHRRTLDLRRGILCSRTEYETEAGRHVVVRTRRCASLSDLHLLLQEVTVCLPDHSAAVELDMSLADPDLAMNHPHLTPLESSNVADGLDVHRFKTKASGVEIAVASRTTLAGDDRAASVRWQRSALIGETFVFRRYVAIYTTRDAADPLTAALRHIEAQRSEDFEQVLASHGSRWAVLWERADVEIGGSPATEQALRFNAYHLMISADRDPRVSVGARALTGRAYEGHVFWDVEIFKLPFYLLTFPKLAKNLLLYRFNTLDGARRRAQEDGYRGASYAWESTVTGDDVTPRTIQLRTARKKIPIFTGTQQVHVTAGVAHGIWQYWEATRDRDFMRDAGVEILIETARFWSSRCSPGPRGLHLRGVVGPDEYHHSVDDNAYTNWMARFNIERAIDAVEWIRRNFPEAWGLLAERLALASDEPERWRTVARELHCPVPNADGLIEQFDGFFDLEDYSLPKEERFKAPVHRLFDWERINRIKVIKQADVLMLLHLFPDLFPPAVVAANYHYYEPMTDHGSSLSPGIHAAIAARLGFEEDAERYWKESLWLDLSNRMGNSALGIHPACMGATWQALVFGFLGIRFGDSGPRAEARARLPETWGSARLTLLWRGRLHRIDVAREDQS